LNYSTTNSNQTHGLLVKLPGFYRASVFWAVRVQTRGWCENSPCCVVS